MNEKINYGYSELDSKQYYAIEDSRDWRESAACKGMDTSLFIPEVGKHSSEAVAICAGCIVVKDCLKYALQNEISHGIWGGKTNTERKKILNNPRLLKITLNT